MCERGQLDDESKAALRDAGIVVVEVADPSKCEFIRSTETVSADGMLWAAMSALKLNAGTYNEGKAQREKLAFNLIQLVEASHEARKPKDADA